MEIQNTNCKEDLPVSNNNYDRFNLTLSVSTVTVATKEEAKKVVDFHKQTYSATPDSDELGQLFKTQLYSTNLWSSGCSNATYIGMTGVTLDFDHGFTIGEAQLAFADFNYILHTSRTHQHSVDGAPGEDRFRVILPFEPSTTYFTSASDAAKAYYKLMTLYPKADQSCTNPGRKFFPSTRELNTPFLLDVHVTGKYFRVDISDVPDDVLGSPSAYEWDGTLRPEEELDRIVRFCPFVRWMIQNIDNPSARIREPLKFALISNLCWFEGGRELIHDILRRDARPHKYDPDLVDAKIDWVLDNAGPHRYMTIAQKEPTIAPLWGWNDENNWRGPLAPAGWGKYGRILNRKGFGKNNEVRINYDDNFIVQADGEWTVTDLATIKQTNLARTKLAAACPFCDAANASFQTDMFKSVTFECLSCKIQCFEFPLAPNMFTYKNEILRVEQREGLYSSIEVLTKEHFRTDEDFCFVRKLLLNSQDRRFLDDNFQVRRVGIAECDDLDYEINIKENALVHRFPPVRVIVEDNALVDKFLDSMFREHSDFIKDWMAMFAYTNYVTLPVIVLQGERSSGKGTFAHVVGGIYPRLMGHWNGDSNNFNEYFRSKLLFVDENDKSEKRIQYTEIKKLTGNKIVRINEKYKPEYYTPNNNNLIIATNDTRPVYLDWKETPKAENVNNFFIYKCPDVPAEAIIPGLEEMLKARIGHYVRTELKKRFEVLAARGYQNNRYALAAPITDFARNLYESSPPQVQIDSEELAQYIVCGVSMPDPYNSNAPFIQFKPKVIDGKSFVRPEEIRILVDRLRLKSNKFTYKSFITALQDAGVLSHGLDRESHQRKGYEILRSPDYYDTTTSDVLTVDPASESNSYNAALKRSIFE